MLIEVIPAIIAKDFRELKEKVERVEPYVKWVHIDVMDGNFVPNFIWNKPKELKYYDPGVLLEMHLMISEPEKYVPDWIDAGCKRIIFHIESTTSPQAVTKICREHEVEVAVAINPDTPASVAEPILGHVDMVLVMGVTPGFCGQDFKRDTLEKIKALRKENPHLTIEVDGGMNPKTAKRVVEAGANMIVAGSYIFGSKDIQKAVDELKNVNSYSS